MRGTFQGVLSFSKIEIYIGIKNGKSHCELSFLSLGIMHEKTENITMENDVLQFELKVNDTIWLFKIQLRDGIYKCILNDGRRNIEIKLEKISDKYTFLNSYITIPIENIELLREYKDYFDNQSISPIHYELSNVDVKAYLNSQGLIFKGRHSLSNALKIMRKICSRFSQDGINYTHSNQYGTIANIKWAAVHNYHTNCRGMAIIFAGILRCCGYIAGHTTCFPYDKDDTECHVVVEVFIPEYNKFVMFDPTMNLVLFNKDIPQNLLEIRGSLIKGEQLIANEDASHNGKLFDLVEYLAYLSKNLFCFQKCLDYNEIQDADIDNSITLIPINYNEKGNNRIMTTTSETSIFYGYKL